MGTDVNASVSASSSATSGVQRGATVTRGDVIAGGFKLPTGLLLGSMLGLFVLASVWIVAHAK